MNSLKYTHIQQCLEKAVEKSKKGVCLICTDALSGTVLPVHTQQLWEHVRGASQPQGNVARIGEVNIEVDAVCEASKDKEQEYERWMQGVHAYEGLIKGSARVRPSQLGDWGITHSKLGVLLEFEKDIEQQVKKYKKQGAQGVMVCVPSLATREPSIAPILRAQSNTGSVQTGSDQTGSIWSPKGQWWQTDRGIEQYALRLQIVTQVVEKMRQEQADESQGEAIGLMLVVPESNNAHESMYIGGLLGAYGSMMQKVPEGITLAIQRVSMAQDDFILWGQKTKIGLNATLGTYLQEHQDIMQESALCYNKGEQQWGSAGHWWELNVWMQKGCAQRWSNEQWHEQLNQIPGFLDSLYGQQILQTYFMRQKDAQLTEQFLDRIRRK